MGAKLEWKRKNDDLVYFGNKGCLMVGEFSSYTAGKGIKVGAARTGVLKVHADDGGVILASGTLKAIQGRMLLTAVHTAGTFCGIQGQIKQVATGATPDWAAGIWGYAEVREATLSAKSLFGVRATVDIPTGVTITSGGIVAGLVIDSIDLGGTHTGKAVCIYVPEPGDGDWDAFMEIAAANTCVDSSSTKSTPSGVDNWLIVNVGGTAHYIPMYHSKTA